MNPYLHRCALPFAVAFALAGANFAAHAQESKDDEAFQQRLFGRALDGKQIHACFSRVYDAGHLAQHPRQNVRTMLLLVRASFESDQPSYALRLGVTFRKSGAHFDSAGNCGSIHDTSQVGGTAGVAHCGVDCDGGSIDVAIKDAKSVLVSIPNGARIWRAGSNDKDEAKRFGADDKVFRLDKVALDECLRLADDSKEKAAMRRGQ
ncbi:MAG TPA: hypothetical protein VGN55_00415 [Xanthobacteraceae bacterium]